MVAVVLRVETCKEKPLVGKTLTQEKQIIIVNSYVMYRSQMINSFNRHEKNTVVVLSLHSTSNYMKINCTGSIKQCEILII
jgi:hypothetical protein